MQAKKPRIPFLTGAVVHDVIGDWAKAGYPLNHVGQSAAQHYRRQAYGLAFVNKAAYFKYLRRAISGAIIAERLYRMLHFQEHGAIVEERFKLPIGALGDNLIGAADVYDPETFTVFDLKLHISTDVSEHDQLVTYALAEHLAGRKVEHAGIISPLKPNKVITEPISLTEIESFGEILTRALEQMKKGVTPNPVKGSYCFICSYKGTAHCTLGVT